MKLLGVFILAMSVALSGCGKKKKKDDPTPAGNPTTKPAGVSVSSAFKIALDKDGKAMTIVEADPENSENQSKDNCSLETVTDGLKKERKLTVELVNEKTPVEIAIKNSADTVLLAGSSPKGSDQAPLGYYEGGEGLSFTLSESSLTLNKVCPTNPTPEK